MKTPERLPSLKHLLLFTSVAEARSVVRGAAAVNLSQPAATHAIRNLEAWAGTTLFERESGGVTLTEGGGVFLEVAKSFVGRLEAAMESSGRSGASPLWRLKPSHCALLRAVAEFETVDVAADAAGLSGASAARTARDLEAALGMQLFERLPGGLSATAAGKLLARAVDRGWTDLELACASIGGQNHARRSLHVGVQSLSSTALVASAINDLLAAEPDADVRIVQGSIEQTRTWLESGRVDIVLGGVHWADAPAGLRQIPLFHNPYCVAARAGHPLGRKKQVTLDDLSALDWVLPGAAAQRRQAFERLFAHSERRPTAQIDTASVACQVALLLTSDRVALLTPVEMALDPHMQGLTKLPCAIDIRRSPEGLTVRADWLPTTTQAAFLDCLTQRLMQVAPELVIGRWDAGPSDSHPRPDAA